eukprot:scaffold108129_cov50-Attheya_sp.AAC.1
MEQQLHETDEYCDYSNHNWSRMNNDKKVIPTTTMANNHQEKEDRGRLLLAWVHNEIRNGTVSNELWKQCRECPELLMRGNSIGWTALHFATSHHAPQQQQQQQQQQANHIGIPSPQIAPPWMWMWMLPILQQQHGSNHPNNNPWEARNEVGQSPVDLFFLTHLHPLPWQRPEVHRAARRLRACFSRIIHIMMIAPQKPHQQQQPQNTNALIGTTIRRRFIIILRQTQQEQPPYDDTTRWTTPRTTATTTTTTTIHADYYDWEESSEEDNDSDSGEAQEEMDLRQLVEFWHPMEVLLRAATATGTTQTRNRVPQKDNDDDDDDDEKDTFRVVHALARTNCPPCVAQLAVLLYPSQPREWQRQRQPNYYEEDAHPPKQEGHQQQQLVHLQQLLPLHICLTSPNAFDDWTTTSMRNTNANHDTNHATTTNATVNVTSGATRSIRRVLLDVYPEGAAASIPCDPNTTTTTTTTKTSPLVALELALEVGRVEDWGTGHCGDDDDNDDHHENGGLLEELLQVYPEALHTWSGIPPFVRAALARVSPEAATVHAKTHRRSNSIPSIRTTTSMWKFLPPHSQATAMASAHDELNLIQLTAIYKLLRASPSQLPL